MSTTTWFEVIKMQNLPSTSPSKDLNLLKLLVLIPFLLVQSRVVLASDSVEPYRADIQTIPVKTMVIGSEKPKLYRTFSGTSRAADRVSIRSQVSGRLLERTVDLGAQVEKGDILARLYNPEATPLALAAKQNWEQSQVQTAQHSRNFNRIESLYKSGATTKQDFENARTSFWAAKTTQAAAKSRYQRAAQVNQEQLVRAPFKGVITQVAIEEGEVVNAGQSLMQLANPNQVETEVTVSERIASSLKKGDLVRVTLPLLSPGIEVYGHIKELTPFRERGALPTVVIQLPSETVTPGLTAQIHFAIEDNSQFALPISAVIKTGRFGSAVYRVIDQMKVELIPIRPHQLIGNQVTVSGDLNQQDRIVIAGVQQLYDGANINIVNKESVPALNVAKEH